MAENERQARLPFSDKELIWRRFMIYPDHRLDPDHDLHTAPTGILDLTCGVFFYTINYHANPLDILFLLRRFLAHRSRSAS
jgi:hypothetical protein